MFDYYTKTSEYKEIYRQHVHVEVIFTYVQFTKHFVEESHL